MSHLTEKLFELLPHGPSMCLIDEVQQWDSGGIECVTQSHRNKDNPLLINGVLPASALIEYAAQVAGIHLALAQMDEAQDDNAVPDIGYVAAIKNIALNAKNVNSSQLTISAKCLIRQQGNAIYEVVMGSCLGQCFCGRISLIQQG